MAPRKWIDRNAATTYRLVHRPQNDPLIHDADAGDMVFQEQLPPQAQKKGVTLSDLNSEYSAASGTGSRAYPVRDNEGEAAEYGVYYDDTDYDYMQHLRDLGEEGEQGHFVEATPVTVKGKGKGKEKGKEAVSLDEALRQLDLDHEKAQAEKAGKLVDEAILPSKNLRHYSYQNMQDVPDALAGFQPDMDPRLREALEALEDEEYVDNEDQDLFDMLAGGAREIEDEEFEESFFDEEEAGGYESDDTAKPVHECREEENQPTEAADTTADMSSQQASQPSSEPPSSSSASLPPSDAAIPDAASDPFAAFNAHKAQLKASPSNAKPIPSTASAIKDSRMHAGAAASTIMSNASLLSRSGRKKRKGALTNPSSYSMTSSALHRNEGLTTLDRRFDRILEAEYEEDDDGQEFDDGDGADTASVATGVTGKASVVSGISAASGWSAASSQAPSLVRRDYSGVMGTMDEFLTGFGGGPAQQGDSRASTRKGGKTRRGYGGQTGMQQLDEIRKDLGRPKITGVR